MDLIDRVWLLEAFHNKAFDKVNTNAAYDMLRWGIKVIKQAQSARLKGKWIESPESPLRPFMCSNCGCIYDVDTLSGKPDWNYCPECGARMVNDESAD